MDDETRTAVEVEVRRVMQSQDQTLTNAISHLSESYNNAAASCREHLQRQFRYLTIGVSVVLTTIGGAFVFYTGKNIDESKELRQATIDQKVVEYRIVDNLKHRLDDQVVMAKKNKMGEKEVEDLISKKVNETTETVLTSKAADILANTNSSIDELQANVRRELEALGTSKIEAVLNDAVLPRDTVIAFAGQECPTGWVTYEEAQGRFISGVNTDRRHGLTNHRFGEISGEEKHILTAEEMPSHTHGPEHEYWFHAGVRKVKFDQAQAGFKHGLVKASIGEAGGSQPHNNMPPYIALNFCKKV